MATPWDLRFETILRTHLAELTPGEPLSEHARLIDLGLDSSRTLGLILDIQDQYHVTFTDDQLTPDTFATAASLWATLATLTDGPQPDEC